MVMLREELLEALDEVAVREGKPLDAFIETILADYLRQYHEHETFEARIDDHIRQNKWLLDELAKQ
jgi:metal-responsive CopG/Arc/MetJ family transcriptional regulator